MSAAPLPPFSADAAAVQWVLDRIDEEPRWDLPILPPPVPTFTCGACDRVFLYEAGRVLHRCGRVNVP